MTDEQAPSERVDWFMADVFSVTAKVGEKEMESLIAAAVQYLKVGRLDWKDWSLLSPSSRAAFAAAAASLKIEGAFKL